MAKPSTRQELIDYCFRKLGAPVLEINVDDDQADDLVDDALQLFGERHFDGIERMYLKYELTQEDIDRGKAAGTSGVGIVTTTGNSTNISGLGTVLLIFTKHQTLYKYQIQLLELIEYLNLIQVQYLVVCLVLSISYF